LQGKFVEVGPNNPFPSYPVMQSIPREMSNTCRQWAAWLYQLVTQRQRQRLRQELTSNGQFPIAILFYHRVADHHINPWTISRRHFVQHLDWLQENFDVVSLAEAQRRVRSGFNDRPSVAITFDDGYSENCEFAIPELVRRQMPVTYFVVSQSIAGGIPFAHDQRQHVPLAPNTLSQVRDMHRAGIEIGAHTRTHKDIGRISSPEELAEELLGSIRELESWGLGPIRYFSFPYGLPANTSQAAVDLLASAGIEGFCTAYGAWNWPGAAGFHLRRIHADPGLERLKNWLTLDRRKLHDNRSLPFVEPLANRTASAAGEYVAV
jgi:peptidoglycan/xylan/chitin deacetylase (PgdA/CDA1 family)